MSKARREAVPKDKGQENVKPIVWMQETPLLVPWHGGLPAELLLRASIHGSHRGETTQEYTGCAAQSARRSTAAPAPVLPVQPWAGRLGGPQHPRAHVLLFQHHAQQRVRGLHCRLAARVALYSDTTRPAPRHMLLASLWGGQCQQCRFCWPLGPIRPWRVRERRCSAARRSETRQQRAQKWLRQWQPAARELHTMHREPTCCLTLAGGTAMCSAPAVERRGEETQT